MKPSLPGFLLAAFLLIAAGPLFGQANPPTGVLGLPLGTFAVIEGTEHPYGMGRDMTGFAIESINGKKLEHIASIRTEWPSQLEKRRVTGKRYVLHGYERGEWGGEPDLPKGERYGAQVIFGFFREFVVTSIEKIDGETVADAKPLDPKVPLAEPNFEAKRDDKPPVGILGLPLGTFAIIQARTPERPVLLESPFEVVAVNGKPLDNPPILIIRGVPETKGNEQVTLHGFEAGSWESEPDLPQSENPSGTQVQQPFQFYHQFILTTPVKSGG